MMFVDNAARLAGLAGALLGWRPSEFWCATPQELGAVMRVLAGEEPGAVQPLDTTILEKLKARFPD